MYIYIYIYSIYVCLYMCMCLLKIPKIRNITYFTSFIFTKIRKFRLDSLLLFPLFSAPDIPISLVHLLIHLPIVEVPVISVFANLMKNYFKPLYRRKKCSRIKVDEY